MELVPPAGGDTPEALLARWRGGGDAAALAALFDATAPDLFRIALATAPDPATAEDALQETFLALMEAAPRVDLSRPLVPFLVGILRHKVEKGRARNRRIPDPARLPDPDLRVEDPVRAAERSEEAEKVRRAILALPEAYRQAALLRWTHGLEPAEIAEVLGKPPGTVWSLLSRARERLKRSLAGVPVVANLAKMPHLLIAGTTGSGKSVAINTMILSLLYKLGPEECRLIMIDPKMLELSVYDGIPHLLSPVVTDPKKAVGALKWVVAEMEERYRRMSKMGVRNIEGYNGRVREALAHGEMFRRTIQTGFDEDTGDPVFETEEFEPRALPYIVVVVDEMADLMMVAGKEIEACIQRLAQMARASGIHLIMATQRPSVDVITGTIKANFPTRISFQVTSRIDSRTILGEMGAEQLLGQGDMLYMAGGARITRIHGPFVSDEEVEEIVNHLKSLGPPSYVAAVLEDPEEAREGDIDAALGLGGEGGDAALYD
ncbi:MAG: sigma-70 family RNA polymerase sigma factor, partial [Planctomycetaceae bacterium]|nr:sigma-70 family RNA polymerase sigma factor [Planctomycetaceae bacterium]